MQGLVEFTLVGVNAEGVLDPAHIKAAVTDATCLISIMHSNNEVGSVQPVAAIADFARQHNLLSHTDAAQSIGKVALLTKAIARVSRRNGTASLSMQSCCFM